MRINPRIEYAFVYTGRDGSTFAPGLDSGYEPRTNRRMNKKAKCPGTYRFWYTSASRSPPRGYIPFWQEVYDSRNFIIGGCAYNVGHAGEVSGPVFIQLRSPVSRLEPVALEDGNSAGEAAVEESLPTTPEPGL